MHYPVSQKFDTLQSPPENAAGLRDKKIAHGLQVELTTRTQTVSIANFYAELDIKKKFKKLTVAAAKVLDAARLKNLDIECRVKLKVAVETMKDIPRENSCICRICLRITPGTKRRSAHRRKVLPAKLAENRGIVVWRGCTFMTFSRSNTARTSEDRFCLLDSCSIHMPRV